MSSKVQVTMDSQLAKDGKLILNELGLNPTSFILMNSRQQKTIDLDTVEKVKKWIDDED